MAPPILAESERERDGRNRKKIKRDDKSDRKKAVQAPDWHVDEGNTLSKQAPKQK